MRKSELLDSFVKIAEDKGLLTEKPSKPAKAEAPQRGDVFESFAKLMSNAAEPEHTEKEGKVRWDSLSIEQIGKLYNTKPEMPDDMKYEHNIMEDAHPDTLVISPAHDKINGLIENNIEGQNIRLRIVMKTPNGQNTHHKYAKKNLVLSLVSLANKLDNEGQGELCKLADSCLMQVSGGLKKKAFPWVVAGIAAAVGLLYLQQHKDFHPDGLTADYNKAIAEINDLLESGSSWQTKLEAGATYTPAFLQAIGKLKDDLGKVYAAAQKVTPALQSVTRIRTKTEIMQELARIAQDPKTQEADQAVKEFTGVVVEVYPEVARVISNFSNQSYKNEVTASKGALTKAVDWTEILHGGHGLVSDDFDDVKHALVPLWNDINGMVSGLKNSKGIVESLKSELTAAEAEQTKAEQPVAPTTETETATQPAGSPEENLESLLK